MPKSNRTMKVDNRTVHIKAACKHKIGPRKTGTSANLMSTAKLEAVLADSNMKKYHNNARNVLATRA